MRWTVETFDGVDAEVETLPPVSRRASSVTWKPSKMSNWSNSTIRMSSISQASSGFRAKASEGIARGIYVTVTGRRDVILHIFVT
jgi:hypothetical protein